MRLTSTWRSTLTEAALTIREPMHTRRPTPLGCSGDGHMTWERIIDTRVATTELKAKATMTFARTIRHAFRDTALPGSAAVIVDDSTEQVR